MDEQEDLPKDMLEQVGSVSPAPLWLPHAGTMLCKVLGTKSTALSVLGPKLFTSHVLKNHPGGQERAWLWYQCWEQHGPHVPFLYLGLPWNLEVGLFCIFVAAA